MVRFIGQMALMFSIASLVQAAEAAKKPAVLFACPGENRYEYVGYDYLRSLVQAGFEVDYVEGAAELTWDRVQRFHVLVVLDFPGRKDGPRTQFAAQAPWLEEYFAVVDRFRRAGGGVFLHYSPGYGGVAPNDLLKAWGLQFPVQYIEDSRVERLTNLGHGNRCAFTNRVLPSPVSEGVRQLWYPIDVHYTGAHTMPILVDDTWQVVVRPSPTAYTVVPTFERGGIQPAPGALIPPEPIRDPVLFAIREAREGGRLAAVQTWHQFSIGSGLKWHYNGEILEKGLAGQPSHYGRLLLNTYRWLAEPAMKTAALGGHVTDPVRLTELQLRPGAMKAFAEWIHKEEEVLEYRRPPSQGKLFRGLIGAQTSLSGGRGTVADFARAAGDVGLDFVVFLEDFARLTPEKLQALKADVKQHSTDTRLLLAGYRMTSNIGNHLFIFGENVPWPEERVLVGPDQRTFNLQYQDAAGKWAMGNAALDWCLAQAEFNNIGYYFFTRSGKGMKMQDLRVYSAAALRTYEDGRLVEDMTADYLETCQSTAVPTPVSVSLVRSPEELRQAVAAGQALTYAQARSLRTLFRDALRWNCSYDGLNVFPSDGPLIRAWPRCARTMTFGAEHFVTGRSLAPSPVHVTSEVGLKEIRIYNGRELFRRFLCQGQKEFSTTLFLSGVVQRNMVLVAEDVKGGRAVSFAYRSYKEGAHVPIFCSDHVNDCGYMLLAHGPHWPGLFPATPVPDAGATWDGGPVSVIRLLSGQFTYPRLDTSLGHLDWTPYQVPLLEFSDEAATRCRMVCDRVLAEGVPNVNPWHTFGPLEPAPLVDVWASHAYFQPSIVGVMPNSYGAPGVIAGPFANLFTEQFTFKKPMTVQGIRVFHGGWRARAAGRSVLLAVGRGRQIHHVLDLSVLPERPRRIPLPTGAWMAVYSSQPCNTQLLINRGKPLRLHANPATAYWIELWADLDPWTVQPADTYEAELFTMTWPMDQMLTDARQIADLVAWLDDPAGLELKRGRRGPRLGGLLELEAVDHAVEVAIPRPADLAVTVPLRVSGFNRRWTVGHYQFAGHRTHYYSKGQSGWRELGLDFDGRAYLPLYVSMADRTHALVGHPVVADKAGQDLFIQVTRINDGTDQEPPAWHVSVNNPLDRPVTTELRPAMDLPGLQVPRGALVFQPGEYRVLTPAR